jgi:hypothetical protein
MLKVISMLEFHSQCCLLVGDCGNSIQLNSMLISMETEQFHGQLQSAQMHKQQKTKTELDKTKQST